MKKGFVLMETIVVISVLCVILVILYASYNKVLTSVSHQSLYNNTEYIYKSNVVRQYLESKINITEFMGSNYLKVYCSDNLELYNNCSDGLIDGSDIFRFLKVKSVYLTLWDTSSLGTDKFIDLEVTTQQYIKSLDTQKNDGVYRVILMYETLDANNNIQYQYASLRFGSRG